MLQLLPTFVLLALGFYGWGTLICAEGSKPISGIGWRGLMGFAVAFIAGSILHFWFPLKWISPAFVAAGVGLAIIRFARCGGSLKAADLHVFCVFALLTLCAVFSAREPIHGDTGLYHMQAVQWITDEHCVAGLANLHGRFGFNSAWWVVAAMMQMPWLPPGGCVYMATGLLGFFFGLLVLGSLGRLWSATADCGDIVIACASYLWVRQLVGVNNPSFGTDAPANLLGVAAAACLVRACVNTSTTWAGMAMVFASLAAATKLSAAVWLPGACLVFLLVAFRSRRTAVDSNLHFPLFSFSSFFPLVVSGLIGLLWMARGYISSGYPLYPVRLLGLPWLPWAVPVASITRDVAGIQEWPTRGGAASDSITGFIWRWVGNQYGLTNIAFALAVLLAGIVAVGILFQKVRQRGGKTILPGLAPFLPAAATALGGLAFCFIAAPAMRFASGYFFALVGVFAAGAASIYLGSGFSRSITRNVFRKRCSRVNAGQTRTRALAALLVASALVLNAFGAIARIPSLAALPPLPTSLVGEQLTKQGVAIRIPADGFAWNAMRPSTPYFDRKIRFIFGKDGSVRIITRSGD